MRVGPLQIIRFYELSDGNDVMDIWVATDFGFRFRTDDTLVPVPLESLASDPAPTHPVVQIASTLPVRMARPAERLGEPGTATRLATDHHVTGRVARIPFDGITTHSTLEFDLTP